MQTHWLLSGFLLIAVLHLLFCARNDRRGMLVTKPLLLLFLAACYLLFAARLRLPILLALLCGCVGDTFLLFPKKQSCFFLGGGAFALGHVLYSSEFSREISGAPLGWSLGLGLVYLAIAAAAVFKLKPRLKARGVLLPCVGYLLLLCAMSFFTVLRAIAVPDGWRILVAAGSGFFLLSDGLLAENLFGEYRVKRHFYVMLTYILAQGSIAFGMLHTV